MAATQPNVENITIQSQRCDLTGNCDCTIKISKKENVLQWGQHIEYVSNNLRKLIYNFLQLCQILYKNTLNMVCSFLVESVISYGLVVWGLASKETIRPLEVLQKTLIKIMLHKDKRYPSRALFWEAKLFNMQMLLSKTIARFMIKHKKYKELRNTYTVTRSAQNNKLVLPKMQYARTQKHISYIGPKIYNIIPDFCKDRPYTKIKRKLKSWIFENNVTFLVKMYLTYVIVELKFLLL